MNVNEILKHVDHTLLLQGATWEEIRQICDDGIKYQTASVCIPPCYVILKAACGDNILKVIIETCLLTEEEKIKMCELVTNAGADYIKTSTGFSTGGATFDDIRLFAKHVGEGVKIKAAGGISNMDDAEKFLTLGADRLGTSRIVKIVKKEEGAGY